MTEIARIEEKITTTGAGGFCFVMLVLNQASLALLVDARGAIMQSVVATIWVGGNVIWGLGVALGRRRTYIVTRAMPQEPAPFP